MAHQRVAIALYSLYRPIAAPAAPAMAQQAPLALTDVAHGEQKGWRRNTHLVDALPYVDGLSPAEKAAVDKLIEEEVRDRRWVRCWLQLAGSGGNR